MVLVIDPTATNMVVVAFAMVGMFVVVVFGVVYVAPFAYHMGRGAWYAARYPAGPAIAANMLRDERALFDDARVAMVIGDDDADPIAQYLAAPTASDVRARLRTIGDD